jgi:hypothetical protein
MPGWPDISPKRFAAQLPMIWFYTNEPQSDTFTGRLSAEHISSIFGRNFRGVPMSELYPAKDFPQCFRVPTASSPSLPFFVVMAWSSGIWGTC